MFSIFKFFSNSKEEKNKNLTNDFTDFLVKSYVFLCLKSCVGGVAEMIRSEFFRIAFTHIPDTKEGELEVEYEIDRVDIAADIFKEAKNRGLKNAVSIYCAARDGEYRRTTATIAEKNFIFNYEKRLRNNSRTTTISEEVSAEKTDRGILPV